MENQPEVSIESTEVSARGCAQEVTGQNVEFGPGVALSVSAEENMTVTRAGAVVVRAGEDMEFMNGGAAAFIAGGDMEVMNGGGQIFVAGGDVEITNGGAQYLIAGGEVTANKTFIAVAISDKLTLNEGSRVLLDTPRAIAFGAAFGAMFALFSMVFRRRRK